MLHTTPLNITPSNASNQSATNSGTSAPTSSASTSAPMSETVALFAWPDYAVAGELDYLFGEFALNLLGR